MNSLVKEYVEKLSISGNKILGVLSGEKHIKDRFETQRGKNRVILCLEDFPNVLSKWI